MPHLAAVQGLDGKGVKMEEDMTQQIAKLVGKRKGLRPCFAQIHQHHTRLCDGRCEYPVECVCIVMEFIYQIKDRRD